MLAPAMHDRTHTLHRCTEGWGGVRRGWGGWREGGERMGRVERGWGEGGEKGGREVGQYLSVESTVRVISAPPHLRPILHTVLHTVLLTVHSGKGILAGCLLQSRCLGCRIHRRHPHLGRARRIAARIDP
jgi:hypothetical protein